MPHRRRHGSHKHWLAVLLLLALAGYLAFDLKKPVREPGTNPTLQEIMHVDPATIAQVVITHGAVRLTLVKRSEAWSVQTPIAKAADGDQIKSMLQALFSQQITWLHQGTTSALAKFGLLPPPTTCTFTSQTGEQNTIEFGGKAAQAAQVYGYVPSSKQLVVLTQYTVDALTKDPQEYRDKTVLDVTPRDVTQLELRQGTATVKLKRNEADHWRIISPIEVPADSAAVLSLLQSLHPLKATMFAPNVTTPQAGLLLPSATVTAVTNTARQTVLFGGKAPSQSVYVRSAAPSADIAVVYVSTQKMVLPQLDSLLSKQMVDIDPRTVTSLAISRHSAPWAAHRVTGGWKLDNAYKGETAKSQAVEGVLLDITSPAERVITVAETSPALTGLTKPVMKVTLVAKTGPKVVLTIGADAGGGGRYAAVSTMPQLVYVVQKSVANSLMLPSP